ncbi:MAG: exo-alpha-sialidase [Alphaproteobacteria bacterium]|nr:exo-alpha-sialidase [Alphaproteobacteria bacterium]
MRRNALCTVGLLLTVGAISHASAQNMPAMALKEKPALAVGATIAALGALWIAHPENGHLWVKRSSDGGRSFTPPAQVTPAPETVTADAENRPKIAVGQDGIVHVSWTQNLGERMTGFIRYAHSTDGGKHFSTPLTLNSDRQIISHRFDTLATDGKGGVAVAWLDARSRTGKIPKGSPQTQVGVYAAVSQDGGASFAADRLVADHSCQCCRTGMTWTSRGPVVFWRHVFGKNIRDFAVADLAGGKVHRVTDDEWEIDGCPHHGGGIAADGHGNLHVVWFTAGKTRQGIFYRRLAGADFRPDGKLTGFSSMHPPMPLGQPNHQPGHPDVVAKGNRILLSWREFDGDRYSVWAMLSRNAGETWNAPLRLAESRGAADYAVPVVDEKQAMVVWNTADEGLRILTVEAAP